MAGFEQKRFWISSSILQEEFQIWQLTYRKNVELLRKNSMSSITHSQGKRNILLVCTLNTEANAFKESSIPMTSWVLQVKWHVVSEFSAYWKEFPSQ